MSSTKVGGEDADHMDEDAPSSRGQEVEMSFVENLKPEEEFLEQGGVAPNKVVRRSISERAVALSEREAKKGFFGFGKKDPLKPFQRMFMDRNVLKYSMIALRCGVFADTVNNAILQPNYPIMVLENGHPDSFPSTGGFGFSAATYFLPMTGLLGVAIASTIIGNISDKVGRKPCILACFYGSIAGSMAKYFLRKTFWGFCAASFVNGLFSASIPVSLAYLGDVFPDRKAKDTEFGYIIGMSMLGASGGGICAILMDNQGLFMPLWIGVALMSCAAIFATFFLIEPSHELMKKQTKQMKVGDQEEEEEDVMAPEEIDWPGLVNIIIGSLADNLGSSGLLPLCLSPLAFNAYYTDFVDAGEEPVMSQIAYKWIAVMVALMVIPSTLITPPVYAKVGIAGGCVLGNFLTAIVTICLLYIGLEAPPTGVWFAIFVVILYAAFPFTVISQLSTGPMLDRISPVNKRGFTQGINVTVMNLGTACSPFLFGLLADNAGTLVSIWVCIGVSFAAALINTPLMFKKGFGPVEKKLPDESRPLKGEDYLLVKKALAGEFISQKDLDDINLERMSRGQPFLVIHYGKYEDEKAKLQELRARATADYQYSRERTAEFLSLLNNHEDITELCEQVNASTKFADEKEVKAIHKELGEWFVEYLVDSGYSPHTTTTMTKQMIMSAFPLITHDKELTPENAEEVLLKLERVYQGYAEYGDDNFTKVSKLLAHAGVSRLR